MNMVKKGLVFIVLLCLFIVMPLLVACNDAGEDEITISLNEKEIVAIFNPLAVNYTLAIPAYENVGHYKVTVYPRGDLKNCLFTKTVDVDEDVEKVTVVFSYDIIKWQYLDVYIVGYSEDYLVSSSVLIYELNCALEEEDIVIADETEPGTIDGYDDPSYYYVKLDDVTNIVESDEDVKYAILVDNVSSIASIEMPFMYTNCYELNEELGAIVINKDCINSFELGALIPMTINYSDESKYRFDVAIVAATTPTLDDMTFDRGYASDITYNCLKSGSSWSLAGVTFDGTKMALSNYTNTSTSVTVKSTFLNTLSIGTHTFRVYYKSNGTLIGYSESLITINPPALNKAPYNLKLSFDDSYPAVKVTWDVDYPYQEAILYVNDVAKLSSVNQHELFEGNSITIINYIKYSTDKVQILIRYADGSEFRTSATYLDFDVPGSTAESFFTDKVSYIGKNVNRYISSEDELNDFVAYHIIHYGDTDTNRLTEWTGTETYQLYSPYLVSKYTSISAMQKAINNAYDVFIEPLAYTLDQVAIDGYVVSFRVGITSGSTRPYNNRTTTYGDVTGQYMEYPYSELHYYTNGESTRSSSFEGFKVYDREEAVSVETSIELLLALEAGYKPILTSGTNAYRVFNAAKDVLREIVDDRMTDYQKVLAIYDWITYNVIYDRPVDTQVASKCNNNTSAYHALYKNSSFYAEGVFFYGVAVCNGIASALSIMANIEGIPAMKVMGYVSTGVNKTGNHTWNKVYVDGDWFVCDPTWSNAVEMRDSGKHYEYISYDFFMISMDEATYKSRKEYEDKDAFMYYTGNTVFDYYSTECVVYNNHLSTKNIKSIEGFENLFNYYLDSVSSGEEIQFSIEMEKKSTILDVNSSATTVQTWIDSMSIPAVTTITVFSRKLSDASLIEEYNNIVYIRIKKE